MYNHEAAIKVLDALFGIDVTRSDKMIKKACIVISRPGFGLVCVGRALK